MGGHGMIIPNLNPSCEQKEGKVVWVRTTLRYYSIVHILPLMDFCVVFSSTKANSVERSIYVLFY